MAIVNLEGHANGLGELFLVNITLNVLFPGVNFTSEESLALQTEELVPVGDSPEHKLSDQIFIKVEALFMDEEVNVRELGDEERMDCLGIFTDVADGDLTLSEDDQEIVGDELAVDNVVREMSLGNEQPFVRVFSFDPLVIKELHTKREDKKQVSVVGVFKPTNSKLEHSHFMWVLQNALFLNELVI